MSKILLFENKSDSRQIIYRKRKCGGVEFKSIGLGYSGVTTSWTKENDRWNTLKKVKKQYIAFGTYNFRTITKEEMALLI